jgi:hypothetical protein
MSFAIIRGGNGRRHEVDFGDDPVTLDVSAGEATVQITIEATDDPGPSGGRRFATLAVPREELITALSAALGSRPAATIRPRPRLVRTETHDDGQA